MALLLRNVARRVALASAASLGRGGFASPESLAHWPPPGFSLLLHAATSLLAGLAVVLYAPPYLQPWWGSLLIVAASVLMQHALVSIVLGFHPRPRAPAGASGPLVCLRCHYPLGPGVQPPCPECGQPAAPTPRPPNAFRKLRLPAAAAAVLLATVVVALYVFDEFSEWRPHRLLQSDWERRHGDAYARQLRLDSTHQSPANPLRLVTSGPTWFTFDAPDSPRGAIVLIQVVDMPTAAPAALLYAVAWTPTPAAADPAAWTFDVRLIRPTSAGVLAEHQTFAAGPLSLDVIALGAPTDLASIRGGLPRDILNGPPLHQRFGQVAATLQAHAAAAIHAELGPAASIRLRP